MAGTLRNHTKSPKYTRLKHKGHKTEGGTGKKAKRVKAVHKGH